MSLKQLIFTIVGFWVALCFMIHLLEGTYR